jgi:hypothetical protein
MMASERTPCAQGVTRATLSAWRDRLLPAVEMERISQHVVACAACQTLHTQFEEVARVLRSQRELDPGERIVEGVRQRAARTPRRGWMPRGPQWNRLKVLAPIAALLLLFVYVLGTGLNRRAGPTPTPTASTTLGPTATPETLTVRDPALALQLTFAFVQDNDVWVSWKSKAPQQMTHLGVGAQHLIWTLAWSPDQSKLLINETADVDATSARAWILTLAPNYSLTELPASAPVVAGCANYFTCSWLGQRYIIHLNRAVYNQNFHSFKIYDLQSGRDLTTALDDQTISELEVRGQYVYFSSVQTSGGAGAPPGKIERFDLAGNSYTTVYTAPGPFIGEVAVVGGWDLSADASRAVSWYTAGVGVPHHCPVSSCNAYYQDSTGTVAAIFTQQPAGAPILISPDGRYAAALSSGSTVLQIVQQALPSGSEVADVVPSASSGHDDVLLSWAAQSGGVFDEQIALDSSGNTVGTSVFFVPAGSSHAVHQAHFAEKISSSSFMFFAPPAD